MSVHGLGWLGVRTDRFEETVTLYRVVLGVWCHFRGPGGNVHDIISGGGDRA